MSTVKNALLRLGADQYWVRWVPEDFAQLWVAWDNAPELAKFLCSIGFEFPRVAAVLESAVKGTAVEAAVLKELHPAVNVSVDVRLHGRSTRTVQVPVGEHGPVRLFNAAYELCKYAPEGAVVDALRGQFPLEEVADKLVEYICTS